MLHASLPTGSRGLHLVVLLVILIALPACAATNEAAEDDEDDLEMSDVIGSWSYIGSQQSPLYRGVVILRQRGDNLTGTLRDERIGDWPVRGEIRGQRLTLRVQGTREQLHISGRVYDDDFRATIRRADYHVSSPMYGRTAGRSNNLGSFTAQRQAQPERRIDEPIIEECPRVTPIGRFPCS